MAQYEEEEVERQIQLLETQELESPNGVARPEIYTQLLGMYLLENSLNHARLLWKRIPAEVKNTAGPDFHILWSLGRKLMDRDYSGFYAAVHEECGCSSRLSESARQLVSALREKTRARLYDLVMRAYVCIDVEQLGQVLDMHVDEVVETMVSRGWRREGDFLFSPSPRTSTLESSQDLYSANDHFGDMSSDNLLQRFTEFICFVENHV